MMIAMGNYLFSETLCYPANFCPLREFFLLLDIRKIADSKSINLHPYF
jgi:hypothetical protein